jgi:2-polyprenyl-3-methyl-5-hydroxy-6-metoxy-1,4-benzoquinol methylase
MQNKSHVVMAQRFETRDSLDDFPSPPWATRALLEHIIQPTHATHQLSCLEPACGRGHMARTLAEHFASVTASDIHPYGCGDVSDFTHGQRRPALSTG